MTVYRLISFAFLSSLSTLADTQGQILPNRCPQDVEIAWDIHGVLMYKVPKTIRTHLEYWELLSLFPPAAKGAFLSLFDDGLTTPEQQLLKEAFSFAIQGNIGAEGFYHLFMKYNRPKLAQMVYNIAQGYKPRVGIVNIIKELHCLGYTQRIASNIGSEFYSVLHAAYPEVFRYMDGGKTVQYRQPDGTIDYDPIRKPDKAYAQAYEQENPGHKKKIIFIDDLTSNVQGLKSPNWITIKFRSVQQLRRDFIALGIPLYPSSDTVAACCPTI